MREEKIFKIIGDIDDDLIEAAEPCKSVNKRPSRLFAKWAYAAAGFAAVLVLGAFVWRSGLFGEISKQSSVLDVYIPTISNSHNNGGDLTGSEYSSNKVEIDEEIHLIPRWDEMSISEKYKQFKTRSGLEYVSTVCEIPSENIGDKLFTVKLSGYDVYEDKYYFLNADAYEIKGIDNDCALSVKFDSDGKFYSYINSDYDFADLGDMVRKLNLKETLVFGNAVAVSDNTSDTVYANIDRDAVWDMLFSNTDAENVYDSQAIYRARVSFSVSIPLLGIENKALSVTQDGYLETNIFEWGKAFYLGEDNCRKIADFISENYSGTPYTPTAANSPEKPE